MDSEFLNEIPLMTIVCSTLLAPRLARSRILHTPTVSSGAFDSRLRLATLCAGSAVLVGVIMVPGILWALRYESGYCCDPILPMVILFAIWLTRLLVARAIRLAGIDRLAARVTSLLWMLATVGMIIAETITFANWGGAERWILPFLMVWIMVVTHVPREMRRTVIRTTPQERVEPGSDAVV